MDTSQFLGQIAFFSFLGIIASILFCFTFERHERITGRLKGLRFWRRFVVATWIVMFTFGTSFMAWLGVLMWNILEGLL